MNDRERFRALVEAAEAAEDVALAAMEKAFAPGSRVRWEHGRHVYGAGVRVRSERTGREYVVSVHRILDD